MTRIEFDVMNSKQRCMAAIENLPRDRTPVFPLLMFFSANRAAISYKEYATNGLALAQSQLAVRDRFGVDAITACSDAFRVSADLGAEMAYPENTPPFAQKPLIVNEEDIKRLGHPDPLECSSRMADRIRAITQMSSHAGTDCLILGWIDMPFAEACSVCGVTQFLLLLVDSPGFAHKLLNFLAEIVIDFALAQLEAGSPMMGAGDAAASLISPAMYREFALPYEQRVVNAIHNKGGLVKLHICGNTTALLPDMISSGSDLFNVDHMVDFQKARNAYTAAGKCFKGNLNPVGDMLNVMPEDCQKKALECLGMAEGTRYMLSAGCEIPAGVTDETFEAFCSAPKVFVEKRKEIIER